ncbi:MAG: HlyD family efflux transporter periplasmic adaptor subunit [Chloroflexota bacterium]
MIVGCSRGAADDDTPPNTPVPDEEITPTPTTQASRTGVTILADGLVQATHPTRPLAFENGGKLLTVQVQMGDLVQAGDLIATLDDTSARDQVIQAELSLQRAELALIDLTGEVDAADLASAQSNLASAQSNLTNLIKPPDNAQVVAAQQNLVGAQQALQDLRDLPKAEQINIAKANLAAVEIQLQTAQEAYNEIAYLENVGMMPQAINLQEATINYERALAEYNQALAGASEGDIANAQARVAQAQSELDTLQKGPEPDAVTAAQAQVDQAQAALDKLLAGASAKDIATAEIAVAEAQLSLESAQRGLDKVELISPGSGTVISLDASPGALVSSGTPLVTLLDLTQLEFHTTNLSERDLAPITPGQTAVVTLKAYSNDPIAATVARIGVQAGTAVGDAATFPVILTLDETGLDIRPGMTGRVEIQTE